MKPSQLMLSHMRQSRGLNEDDSSEDYVILSMTPEEMVRDCTFWELGSGDWADRIANWMAQVGAKPENF